MPMLEKMGYDTLCMGCRKPKEWHEMADNDLCNDCNTPDPRELAALYAEWQGERRAGLHGEYTDEGLAMRLREMRGKA